MVNPETCEVRFMLESNRIEGEDRLNPGDIQAVKRAILGKRGIKTTKDILGLHRILGDHLMENWVGKWRTCNVCVGTYTAPPFESVPSLMKAYVKKFPQMNSWIAHNEFEKIHPFQDLNGRVGRLIWLSKAVKEGYNLEMPFLRMYYYQTLAKWEE